MMKSSILHLLLVLCALSVTTMVIFIFKSGSTLQDNELQERHLKEIQKLKAQIRSLQQEVDALQKALNDTNITGMQQRHLSEGDQAASEKNLAQSKHAERYIQDELDVIQYASFTEHWIYVVNSGIYGRVLERVSGQRKQEILRAIMFATSQLTPSLLHTQDKFIFKEGIYRTDPGIGTRYEIYFRGVEGNNGSSMSKKVTVFKPFGQFHNIGIKTASTQDLIHIIVPLSGKVDVFTMFMQRFVNTCVKTKENVFLSIVHYGETSSEIHHIIHNVKTTYDFPNIKLIEKTGNFSRGMAIQAAVEDWSDGNVLMFFCDVDIIFRTNFLQRCRLNTENGIKAYYPIVFSLYNPQVVYDLQGLRRPRFLDQIKISSDTGFWRDFGYGMTCQYRDDFLHVQGFSEDIIGWGTEDTLLFRKFAQSNRTVIRAVDHSIFHLWHDKICDSTLPWSQYKSCLMSRGRNEASHGLLGMLAFQEELHSYRERHGVHVSRNVSRHREGMTG